ncbi:cation:dicarboxylate symporter family transporter [Kistimonas asteriae]|uniref:cation:dicarboxylate symporter family transporter n=1 Tax=Kistimonas asteriae TaxID=517724 RepID=UPI001BAB2B4E|nr:cation:dicarboxylase symporter family transporter [Kistimonas asteriae]
MTDGKKKMPLLLKVIIAIIIGILFGQVVTATDGGSLGTVLTYGLRVGATFSDIFNRYVGFFVPLLIVGLVAPSIADLGMKASKALLITVALAYGSAFGVSLIAYLLGASIIPAIVTPGSAAEANAINVGSFLPASFTFEPIMGIITAIALAFSIGLAAAFIKSETLPKFLDDGKQIVIKILGGFIVPLLPYHIGIIFAKMSAQGNILQNLFNFASIIGVIIMLQIAYLLVLYFTAGSLTGRNPITAIKNMLPSYFTALGTQSSTATIPVTLKCAEANGVSEDVRGFTIPLCSTIHLTGSAVTQTFGSMAVFFLFHGTVPTLAMMLPLVIFLGIILIAAPGVPGGAPAATVPVLKSFMGFTPEMSGIMYTLGITNDAFSTASNVAGDGAISMIVDKLTAKDQAAMKSLHEKDAAEQAVAATK